MNRVASLSLAAFLAAAAPALAQQAAPAPAPATEQTAPPADAAPAPAPAAATPPAPDYSAVEEVSTDLGKGVFVITGAGGNSTIAVGNTGVILIDTQFEGLYDKLRAKITSLTPQPILYVVNTHYHPDHTGGNAPFYTKDNALIVAHPQVVERMGDPVERNGVKPPPAAPEALPNSPYPGNGTFLSVGDITAQVSHPPAPAHTDGDTIVVFIAANVIVAGDIVNSATYPYIDAGVGGSIDGMIAATNWIISKSDKNTKIVPGHGAVTDKAGVTAYRDMLVKARDIIAKAKAAGQTEEQVANGNLLAALDAKWKAAPGSLAAQFPVMVYRSLK